MFLILAMVISYLIGSVSTSYIAGKRLKGIDIRHHGSGNAGATNTLRVLGARVAIIVLLVDLLKGVLAVYIGYLLTYSTGGSMKIATMAFSGLAAVIGHNWPIYYGFRGGKGAATSIGVLLTLFPVAALLAGAIAIVLLLLLRYVSVGAITFTLMFPVMTFLLHGPSVIGWVGIMVALLSVWRHRSNVVRLVRGEERKIGTRRQEEV
ncbi:MAG: plsY [Bacilli bacterium]|nr:plsY [Bacilli bacterium]